MMNSNMNDEQVLAAYDAGYGAAKNSESEDACPYAVGDEARVYWMNGFDDGDGV